MSRRMPSFVSVPVVIGGYVLSVIGVAVIVGWVGLRVLLT